MKLSRMKGAAGFFLAAMLSAPGWGATSPQLASQALPGTLNYVEGQAEISSTPLSSKSVGSAELQPGESLNTQQGKAEILLTPGVFVRLGDNSALQMVSPTLTNTEVRLNSGEAMVEVDDIHKANNISVLQDEASIRLLKTGLYDLDANQHQVRVLKGQALVEDGDEHIKVGKDQEVSLDSSGKLKAKKFNEKDYDGSSLYQFSSLRSDYLSEASANQAQQIYVTPGFAPAWWGGPGWYWNSWLGGYTFFPAAGFLYSPFGFGYYSPVYFVHAPYFGYRDFRHPVIVGRPGIVQGAPHAGFADRGAFAGGHAGFAPHGSFGGGFHGFARGGR